MSFYSNLQSTAQRLLTKYGQAVVLERVTAQGAYDTSAGTLTGGVTTANTTVRGALFDFAEGETRVRGELVLATDKRLLLEGGTAPAVKDVAVLSGVRYAIISKGEINPAGTAVIYDCHVRK